MDNITFFTFNRENVYDKCDCVKIMFLNDAFCIILIYNKNNFFLRNDHNTN